MRSLDHTLKQRAMIEVQQKLASAYVRQDNLEDARTSYEAVLSGHERLLAAGSDEPFTRYYVACAAAVMGDAELALTELTEAIRMRRHFIISRARVEPDFESPRMMAR